MKKNKVKVPNRLITDDSLSYSARKLGAILYNHRSHLGTVTKSLACLSKLSGLAISTVRKALQELEQSKYLSISKQYKYDEQKGRYIYTTSLYCLTLGVERQFTLIPKTLLRSAASMGGSEFTVCLYIQYQCGNNCRAFPSLKKMSADLKMAKSTVCRVIKTLGAIGMLLIQKCLKKNRSFSQNSYFFIRNSACRIVTTPDTIAALADNNDAPYRSIPDNEATTGLMIRQLFYPPVNIILHVVRKFNTFFMRGWSEKQQTKALDLDNVGVYTLGRKLYT